jgi:hypothetical protein
LYAITTAVAWSNASCSAADSVEVGEAEGLALAEGDADAAGSVAAGVGVLLQPASNSPAAASAADTVRTGTVRGEVGVMGTS